MNVFICTPTLNSVATLDRTVQSIVDLQGDCAITYHVKDAGSTDGTLARLEYWEARLEEHSRISFSFTSSKDTGMYDAIAESFSLPAAQSADWLSWINSDDYLVPRATKIIEDIDALEGGAISWVAGKSAVQLEDGKLIISARPTTAAILKLGLADGTCWEFFQQEGTFFRRGLWEAVVDKEKFRSFRLAGDWYLWWQLAKQAEVYLVAEPLGVFCKTEYQLSSDIDRYRAEIDSILPFAQRLSSFERKEGIDSWVKWLYHENRGVYLRTMSIAGHYLYRAQRMKGALS